jgi:cob(I)alamin adenosyltransferase
VPVRNPHRGDSGETRLLTGYRVRKDDPRVECVGQIDELSSFLGLVRAALEERAATAGVPETIARLQRIQRDLYYLGAQMARRGREGTSVGTTEITALERDIAEIEPTLPPLAAFVLPAGGTVASLLHVARAVCRRAEREAVRVAAGERLDPLVVAFLNRLSLALFCMARQAAHLAGAGDELA